MGSEYAGTSIRLPTTKTGKNQWVIVEDKSIVTLLRLLCKHTSGGQSKIFPFTSSTFRSIFKASCTQLGLSHRYVPHSLRHGGLVDGTSNDIISVTIMR